MIELAKDVAVAAMDELDRANKNHPLFRSNHEGLAVISEEVWEAIVEAEVVRKLATDMRIAIYKDNDDLADATARKLCRRAVYAACEYIQVAAMAQKYIDSRKIRR